MIKKSDQRLWQQWRLTGNYSLSDFLTALSTTESILTNFDLETSAMFPGQLSRISNFASFQHATGGNMVYSSIIVSAAQDLWQIRENDTNFNVLLLDAAWYSGDEPKDYHVPLSEERVPDGVRRARDEFHRRMRTALMQVATPSFS